MSDYEHYKGILRIVERQEDESLESQCKRILENKELLSYYDTYQEMLLGDFYEKYIIHDDTLYSVEKQNIDPYDDIFNASLNENGDINFEVRYYNGGCGFDEAIEYALNKFIKREGK